MYGIRMTVRHNGITINLRPFSKEDIPILVEHFSSMKTHMFTNGLFGQTLENEIEWYEKNRNDLDSCVWAIQPEGSVEPIGVRSELRILGRIEPCFASATRSGERNLVVSCAEGSGSILITSSGCIQNGSASSTPRAYRKCTLMG